MFNLLQQMFSKLSIKLQFQDFKGS